MDSLCTISTYYWRLDLTQDRNDTWP